MALEKKMDAVPYSCGFCAVGNHWGSKNLSARGSLLRACAYEYTIRTRVRTTSVFCMCDCTKTEREFREMMRSHNIEMNNAPALTPPSVLPAPALRADPVEASAPSAAVPASPFGDRPAFTMLPGGRLQRGNLEELVWQSCVAALDGKVDPGAEGITLKWLQFDITLRTAMAVSPSSGAVHAVLERWSKDLRCELENKPYRLVAMRDDLKRLGPTTLNTSIREAGQRVMRGF